MPKGIYEHKPRGSYGKREKSMEMEITPLKETPNLLDYILQRCEQLKWRSQTLSQIPYPSLHASPIQPGEYYIWVMRCYRNDGTRETYLSPDLMLCVRGCEINGDSRSYRGSDYAKEQQACIWDFLHRAYGNEIQPGIYPCDDAELIGKATWTWYGKKERV